MISVSAHKFYGPKGIGFLYKNKEKTIKIDPVIHGHQEKDLRGGTYNTAGIVGMAEAAKLMQNREKHNKKIEVLRDKLIDEALKIKYTWLNGSREKGKRLPGNANIGFLLIEGESLILHLDNKGIMCSTGSACSSDLLQPSHVLLSLGLKPEEAHGSLRITLGKENTEKDIDYFLEVLPPIIEKLRKMSPFKSRKQLEEFKEK